MCFVMANTAVPEDIIHGVVSAFAHGEIVGNPILHNNKGFFAKLQSAFRRTLVLAADEEITTAFRESRHEEYPAEEQDHMRREQNKYRLLAKAYRRGASARGSGPSRLHDDDDDGGGGDGGSGPGPRTWAFATLTRREKDTMSQYPGPTRNGQGPQDEDVEMQSGSDSDAEMVEESGDEEVWGTGGKTGDHHVLDDVSDSECDLHALDYSPMMVKVAKTSAGVV